MNETTAFELDGFAKAVVEQLATQEGLTVAEALGLILAQVADPISRGLLLGGEDGKELVTEIKAGLPSGQLPVKMVRVVTTDDVSEAVDVVNEVLSAWQESLSNPDDFPYEMVETSYALDALEQVTEGVSDGHDESWELTFPNGDELHLFLSV